MQEGEQPPAGGGGERPLALRHVHRDPARHGFVARITRIARIDRRQARQTIRDLRGVGPGVRDHEREIFEPRSAGDLLHDPRGRTIHLLRHTRVERERRITGALLLAGRELEPGRAGERRQETPEDHRRLARDHRRQRSEPGPDLRPGGEHGGRIGQELRSGPAALVLFAREHAPDGRHVAQAVLGVGFAGGQGESRPLQIGGAEAGRLEIGNRAREGVGIAAAGGQRFGSEVAQRA